MMLKLEHGKTFPGRLMRTQVFGASTPEFLIQ